MFDRVQKLLSNSVNPSQNPEKLVLDIAFSLHNREYRAELDFSSLFSNCFAIFR